jgi:ankyrin repeat protein
MDVAIMAAQNGHETVMLLLLRAGAEAGKCLDDGRSPMVIAAQKGQKAVIETLLRWTIAERR